MAEAFLPHPHFLVDPTLFWASDTLPETGGGRGCELVRWAEERVLFLHLWGNRDSTEWLFQGTCKKEVEREKERRQGNQEDRRGEGLV